MSDKLNDRSQAALGKLLKRRHAKVLREPASSPAPSPRPCVICESTLTAARVSRFPRALTCSTDCSDVHQVRQDRVSSRESMRRRRARQKEAAAASQGVPGLSGPHRPAQPHTGPAWGPL